MQSNIGGDRLQYMRASLLAGNRMRFCAFVFAFMIVPMFWIKGIGGGLDMLILAAMMAFMLRSIDPVFNRLLGGNPDAPAGVVPFLLPVAMTVGFGTIFDFLIVASCVWNGFWSFWLIGLFLVLIARIVVLATTFPLARMVLDPGYNPAGFSTQTTAVQEGFLQRRPAPATELESAESGTSSAFKPFSGTSHTLNDPPPRD